MTAQTLKQKILVLDLDGTLFNCDTTIEFDKEYLKFKKYYFKLFVFYLLLFLEEFGALKNLKRNLLKLIKNEKAEDLVNFAKTFSDYLFKKFLNLNIYKKLIS